MDLAPSFRPCDSAAAMQTPLCKHIPVYLAEFGARFNLGGTPDMRLDMQVSVCRGETSNVRWT